MRRGAGVRGVGCASRAKTFAAAARRASFHGEPAPLPVRSGRVIVEPGMRAQFQGALEWLDSDRADRAETVGAFGARSCARLSVMTPPLETPNPVLCAADGLARLPHVVRLRLEVAGATAQRPLEAFNATLGKALRERIETTVQRILAGKMKRRAGLLALWTIADEVGVRAARFAACRRGCAHCCHTPVAIAPAEARLIAERTGRPMASPPLVAGKVDADYGYHQPCVFLSNGQCSIYAHRAFACRIQFNLDVDALLCELIPGVPVPYLNLEFLKVAYVALLREGVADLRAFFPRGGASVGAALGKPPVDEAGN